MTAPHDSAEQRATVGRMVQQGFTVVSHGSNGHLLLARGSDYQVSGGDMLLAVLTCGIWLLVIAIRAATQHRQVVAVAPDGSLRWRAAPPSPGWLTVTAVLVIGAAGLLVSTVLSPIVAVIAVPIGFAVLARWPTR